MSFQRPEMSHLVVLLLTHESCDVRLVKVPGVQNAFSWVEVEWLQDSYSSFSLHVPLAVVSQSGR